MELDNYSKERSMGAFERLSKFSRRDFERFLNKTRNRQFLIDVLFDGMDFSDVIYLILSVVDEWNTRKRKNTK